MVLAAVKVIQHVLVTVAFAVDAFDIRETVAVDYRWLLWSGALIAVLFAVALAGLMRGKRWSIGMLAILAMVDLLGEFIAQGRIAIMLNVSFIVALVMLVLAIRAWVSGQSI